MMTKLFKCRVVLLLVFFNFALKAQWSIIPPPSSPANPMGSGYPQVSFPAIILPVGNNKVIYAGSVQNSPSGGGYIIAYQVDDFGNKIPIYSPSIGTGGNPSLRGASAYNDSVFCFSHNIYSYGIGYTINGFKTSHFWSVGGGNDFSIFNTTHHLFILSPIDNPVDTFILRRIDIGSTIADTVTYFTKYKFSYPDLPQLSFINDSTGFILTRYKSNPVKMVLLKTIDYGSNWNEIVTDSVDRISSYSFPSPQVGYILKTNGSIYKTGNGGSAWIQVNTPSSAITPTICVKFANDSIGYIGGINGSLGKTTNGGVSWATENTGTTDAIRRIYTFGDSVYFLTSAGKLFKNKPTGTQRVLKALNDNLSVYPNPSNSIMYVEFIKENVGNLTVTITDLLGKELYRQENASQDLAFKSTINIQSYGSGIYFLNINHSGNNFKQKIMISK